MAVGMPHPINETLGVVDGGGRAGDRILTCKKLYRCVMTENMLRIIICVCVCVCRQ